jgi:hypothetical protein
MGFRTASKIMEYCKTVLFGKGKCRKAAVPATVPGATTPPATVGHHGKASA